MARCRWCALTVGAELVQTGKSIQRAPRKRGMPGSRVPSKPASGWPFLVMPLHEGGKKGTPFVAMPDGKQRPLDADEALYLEHFKLEVLPAAAA